MVRLLTAAKVDGQMLARLRRWSAPPGCEVVVSENARFGVIDKIEGWGLRISRETDPRSSSGFQSSTPA